ncbi:MAG: class I SAM-dependent methyltransferase [Phycisphaerae bacterium]
MDRPNDSPPIDHVSAQEGYQRWAAIYDDEDNPLIALESRVLPELVGELRGATAVDLGCGTGRHAIWLAQRGADVTALDFSTAMIERARAKAAGLPIRFEVHDLAQALPLADTSFDLVICGLVFEHIADVGALLREMKRICRPTGRIVITEMHPAMNLRGISARFTDPATGRETRPRSHCRQVSDYVRAVLDAGLGIAHISEHRVDAALAAASPRAAKYLDWPMLLAMGLRRIASDERHMGTEPSPSIGSASAIASRKASGIMLAGEKPQTGRNCGEIRER